MVFNAFPGFKSLPHLTLQRRMVAGSRGMRTTNWLPGAATLQAHLRIPTGTHGRALSTSLEDIYQRKTPLEHILLRPETYVGSIQLTSAKTWVLNRKTRTIQSKDVDYVPALCKLFDEILVNAADHYQRDKKMTTLKVDIDQSTGQICVENDGSGVPVQMHQKEQMYIPELIFGHLLTSSNYDDSLKRVTGGRHGYGAKLTNIFSSEFTIDTVDSKKKLRYVQTFSNNMRDATEPDIQPCEESSRTKITFKPDFQRFSVKGLSRDLIQLLGRRVADVAGCNPNLEVYLNGTRIKYNDFGEYVASYEKEDGSDIAVLSERINKRWEVCVGTTQGNFEQHSFVNSIWTMRGGTHVNYISDQIVRWLSELCEKKYKGLNIKPNQIRNHLSVSVNCLVENPTFDSQTKETLTTRSGDFGSTCVLSDAFLKRLSKTAIVDNIVQWAKVKQVVELKKRGGKGTVKSGKLTIPKLDDANEAGGKRAAECTLIVTEGDSAKSLAVSGLAVVGRELYGVFPVRGKLLNVRDASHKQIVSNEEINNLVKIIGLEFGKEYDSTEGLRYGKVMIMTDQDHDGSHIKGLILNMFHHFWPSLLRIPGFVCQFSTPLLKARKGKKEEWFYSVHDYEQWLSQLGDSSGWAVKYYKGLGTSTSKEAQEYFSNIEEHRKEFGASDSEDDDENFRKAFAKDQASQRKTWLQSANTRDLHSDGVTQMISYSTFINHELIQFSMADNIRSIPSAVDGLKPSQRKVLYGCFKRKLHGEIKVAQLAGYVSEHTAYHHGEASLNSTIVNMAQTFVGSNNINILMPVGQFGTRLEGGKDAASPRYIFTKLSSVTRSIFVAEDDPILEYLEEDGESIEPVWFCPILPMVLVNGCEGIGTGWSTFVPNYDPVDIVNNLQRLMKGEEMQAMMPSYRGFKGTITVDEEGVVHTRGDAQLVGAKKVQVTELPIRVWTQDYKEYLLNSITGKKGAVRDFKENHTDTSVSFTVAFRGAPAGEDTEGGEIPSSWWKQLKLTNRFRVQNMHLFDRDGNMKRYHDPLDVLRDFYDVRLGYYEKRKTYLLKALSARVLDLNNQVTFVEAVLGKKFKLFNCPRHDVLQSIEALDISPPSGEQEQSYFEKLLAMPLSSLTREKVERLKGERDSKVTALEELKETTPVAMWKRDISSFLEQYEKTLPKQ